MRPVSDAEKAEPGPRSWVPDDLIPHTSRNIHIAGELLPSNEWCAFEFPAADAESLKMKINPVDALSPSIKRDSDRGASWWPENVARRS